MLRRLKKYTVYSSVIVAGQASRALDDAPFAGQDESKDRRLSACEDASHVEIFGACVDPADEILNLFDNQFNGPIPTELGQLTALRFLRVPPASPTPGAPRDRPSASQVPRRQPDHRHVPERPLRRTGLLRPVQ